MGGTTVGERERLERLEGERLDGESVEKGERLDGRRSRKVR